jgi:hypothetical protein
MQQIARIRNAPAASRFAAVAAASSTHYELHYRPLGEMRCGFAFPCDSCGQVVMDELSERSLANYLYARAAVGYELEWPQVRRVA